MNEVQSRLLNAFKHHRIKLIGNSRKFSTTHPMGSVQAGLADKQENFNDTAN